MKTTIIRKATKGALFIIYIKNKIAIKTNISANHETRLS